VYDNNVVERKHQSKVCYFYFNNAIQSLGLSSGIISFLIIYFLKYYFIITLNW